MIRALSVYNSGGVKRFHTHPIIGEQTVASHSWGVAILVFDIMGAESPRAAVILQALLHDAPEIYTGDVPSGIKKDNAEVKEALAWAEADWLASLGLPDDEKLCLSDYERCVIKAADCLEGMLFCLAQIRLGNRGMTGAYDCWCRHLTNMESLPYFPARATAIRKELNRILDEYA